MRVFKISLGFLRRHKLSEMDLRCLGIINVSHLFPQECHRHCARRHHNVYAANLGSIYAFIKRFA